MASNKHPLADAYNSAMDFLADMPISKAIAGVIQNPTPQEVGAQVANLGSALSSNAQEATADPVAAAMNYGPAAMGAIIGKGAKVIRFEEGKKLTKAQKEEVLQKIGDSYKDLGAPIVEKVTASGKEVQGYEFNPEYMHKSDITGANIRNYIELPDGRKAHPSELFPEITQQKIDKYIAEQRVANTKNITQDLQKKFIEISKTLTPTERYKLAEKYIINPKVGSTMYDDASIARMKSSWESAAVDPNGISYFGKLKLIENNGLKESNIDYAMTNGGDVLDDFVKKANDYISKNIIIKAEEFLDQ